LPITALRVQPPISFAIWLQDNPLSARFLRIKTRSSVQLMRTTPSQQSPLLEHTERRIENPRQRT